MGFLSRVAGAGGAIALSSAGIGTAAAGGSGAGTASDESDENGSDGDNGGDTDEDGSEAVSDVDVLNFSLTPEHLEAAYYDEFLSEYSESEIERSEAARVFADPGSRFSTYQKIQQVRDHERAHVETLTATIEDLGGTPVEPAEHDFPYETIDEFVSLSATIEAVGVSAYAGAAPLIENDDVLAAALSIHSVEARHTAYFRVLDTNTPFPNAIDPTRTMEEVLDVASQFIVSMDSEGDSDGGDGSDENDGSDDDGGKGELSLADLRATTGSGDDPRAEYAAYENTGSATLDLTGWTVSNDRGVTYSFPDGFALASDERVTLHTRGTSTESELYWGEPEEVWNDRIDTMTVRDADGTVIIHRSYP